VTESRIQIADPLDVFIARRVAQRIAAEIGFPSFARQEIAIVVSELATNILKYARRGDINLRAIDAPPRGPGLEIIAEDEGPPIADLEMALRDGYSAHGPILPERQIGRGGIGGGLGAVLRMTDSFEYRPGPHRKSFHTIRYLKRPARQSWSTKQ